MTITNSQNEGLNLDGDTLCVADSLGEDILLDQDEAFLLLDVIAQVQDENNINAINDIVFN